MKHISSRAAALAVWGAFCLSVTAEAQTITLAPVQDTYVQSTQPNANYGADPSFLIGDGSTTAAGLGYSRGLFQFDLSGLPGGIASAFLRTYSIAGGGGAGSLPAYLYQIVSPWNQNTVTWTTQPTVSPTTVWATAGVGDNAARWVDWDVTELVRKQVTGELANQGWMIVSQPDLLHAGASRLGEFVSSDSVADPSHAPQLVVTPVPEPSTVMQLLVIGLALLGWRHVKKPG